ALQPGPLLNAVVATAERAAAAGHADTLRPMLERLRAALANLSYKKETRQLVVRVEALLGVEPDGDPQAGERWADAARARLGALAPDERAAWQALLRQAANATAARPSARWQTRTAELVAAPALGRARFLAQLGEWLPLVEKPKVLERVDWEYRPPISDTNTRILTALA